MPGDQTGDPPPLSVCGTIFQGYKIWSKTTGNFEIQRFPEAVEGVISIGTAPEWIAI